MIRITILTKVRLKPDTTSIVRLKPDTTSIVRLKPDTTSIVRLKPDTTSIVRLKPDTTSIVRLKPDTTCCQLFGNDAEAAAADRFSLARGGHRDVPGPGHRQLPHTSIEAAFNMRQLHFTAHGRHVHRRHCRHREHRADGRVGDRSAV